MPQSKTDLKYSDLPPTTSSYITSTEIASCTFQPKTVFLPLYVPHLTAAYTHVPFKAFSCKGTHTKPFFFHFRQCTSPPSPLPGIPKSILAIENVKNEERAEEGATSAAAGRVLSRCAHIPVSGVSVCVERIGSDSTVLIKTLHLNKPQSSFSSGWRLSS